MLLSVFAHIFDYRPVCRVSHTSCYIEPFLFSCLNTNSSSEWTACCISHTPWSGWPFLLCCLITNSSWVNCMLYIAHTFIWLPVSFVPPHQKRLIELNCMPYITHATKIWTVFDASSIANVLHLFNGFLHHCLRLLHHTQFSRRVSDCSVTLAASCSSKGVLD